MVMQTGVQSNGGLGVAQANGELDLGALGRALWSKKLRILALTLIAAALAFATVNLITPRYRSEARILIETRENIFLRPDAEKNAMERGATVDQEAVTSQVQLILSRDLAREIIKQLKLGELAEFDPVLRGPSLLRSVLSLTRFIKDPLSMKPEERVLKSYFDRLQAFQVEKSRVIAIEFESEDAELAARVANAIAEGYLALQRSSKQDQTRAAGSWLAGEIESLRKKVADAEAKVEQYRAKANLFIGTNNTTLSNQQLGDYNAQLAAARGQKSDAESKSALIREALKTGAPVEFSDIINSELMRRLSEQRVTLRAQLAEQSSTLMDQHPRIKELRAQIGDLERQMRGEADRLARALENDAKLASGKVDGLVAGLDQLKRQAASTNEQDVQLRALERDAKSQRDLLESYLAKYREASARDNIGAASPDARIISTATVSNTPAWPKKLPIVLIAALAMFALSAGFVLTGELLAALPMQPAMPAPMPAPVPAAADAGARPLDVAIARRSAGSRAAEAPAEAVDDLARQLMAGGETARRITVIGAGGNAGTTTAAIALARELAKRARVVLVDLALGAPNLSAIAADRAAAGIVDLIGGSASFGEIITRDRHSRLHLVLCGATPLDAHAVMTSPRLAVTLEALGRSYDYVVIDAGTVADAALDRLAMLAPRAVLVTADPDHAVVAQDRVVKAGFVGVSVLAGAARGSRAAA
jgi:polysaccharide biosynthesis transport protein